METDYREARGGETIVSWCYPRSDTSSPTRRDALTRRARASVFLPEGEGQADEIQIEREVCGTQAVHRMDVQPRDVEVKDRGVLIEIEGAEPDTHRDSAGRLPFAFAIMAAERHQHDPQCRKGDTSDFHDPHLHAD